MLSRRSAEDGPGIVDQDIDWRLLVINLSKEAIDVSTL